MRLDVWMESHDYPVGYLTSSDSLSLEFEYTAEYLDDRSSVPISLGLPLMEERFTDAQCRAFFQNLLPENDQVDATLTREGLERNDVGGLLFYLGADCSGAVSCLPSGEGPLKKPGSLSRDYNVLSDDDLNDIVRRLAHKEALPDEMRDPSPVAGVQRKIALARRLDGRFALPKPGSNVPTTHILKVPQVSEQRDVLLETAAAELAHACGIDTVIPVPKTFGDYDGLLIERYDRTIDVLGNVRRLHQEDFAQALGLAPRAKYERRGGPHAKYDIASILFILDQCRVPALARQMFLRSIFFNLAIGNTDNHAKNYALIYDQGAAPNLSKAYDMLPIKLNPRYTDELAFNIGGAGRAADLTVEDFAVLFTAFGLNDAAAFRFVNDDVKNILQTIDDQSAEILLQRRRLKDFNDLFGMEAQRIIDLLELDIVLRERDYFAPDSGGWAVS